MNKYPTGSSEAIQMDVCVYLDSALRAIFPTSGLRAHSRTIIGQSNVHILYTNASRKEDCQSNILENDPAFMAFAIWSDSEGFHIEAPTTHSRVLKNAGVKFRKIKGATEKVCAEKLVAWFKKNSAEFLKLGLSR